MVIVAIILPFLTITKATVNCHGKYILSETLLGLVSIAFGCGFSGLLCYGTSYVLDQMDFSMSWHRNTFLAPGIYSTITLLAHVIVQDLVEITFANKKSPISLGLKVQAQLNGVTVFWGIITLGVTVLSLRVGYIFMIILFINLLMNCAIYFAGLHNSGRKQKTTSSLFLNNSLQFTSGSLFIFTGSSSLCCGPRISTTWSWNYSFRFQHDLGVLATLMHSFR